MDERILLGIKAFAFDIDGVMTDGGLLAMSDGDLLRTFNAKDCFAVRMARMHSYPVAVITGGRSESIFRRFTGCCVDERDIYLGSRIKLNDFNTFCSRNSLAPEEVMYVGDDLPDIPVIKACGLGVAPADAIAEVREAADYVSPFNGGKLCFRNVVEMVMKAQGTWVFDEVVYDRTY